MRTLERDARRRLTYRLAALTNDRASSVDPGFLETVQREVEEIEAALRRMQEGRYGECAACGTAIGRQRLLALPEAVLCLVCSGRSVRPTVAP